MNMGALAGSFEMFSKYVLSLDQERFTDLRCGLLREGLPNAQLIFEHLLYARPWLVSVLPGLRAPCPFAVSCPQWPGCSCELQIRASRSRSQVQADLLGDLHRGPGSGWEGIACGSLTGASWQFKGNRISEHLKLGERVVFGV